MFLYLLVKSQKITIKTLIKSYLTIFLYLFLKKLYALLIDSRLRIVILRNVLACTVVVFLDIVWSGAESTLHNLPHGHQCCIHVCPRVHNSADSGLDLPSKCHIHVYLSFRVIICISLLPFRLRKQFTPQTYTQQAMSGDGTRAWNSAETLNMIYTSTLNLMLITSSKFPCSWPKTVEGCTKNCVTETNQPNMTTAIYVL